MVDTPRLGSTRKAQFWETHVAIDNGALNLAAHPSLAAAEAEGIKAARWAPRFHNPEVYERQPAELRGESVPFINSTSVSQAQCGLVAAESAEAKLWNLRSVGVPATEMEARPDAIRIAGLKRHRTKRVAALRAWESAEAEVTASDAGAERLWHRWLTVGSEPEYLPQVIGGLPLP